MAKVTTMEALFLNEIRDLYDAEKQLTKALPKMAKAAVSDELRNAFQEHLGQTENQVERLERTFEALGEKATGKKCELLPLAPSDHPVPSPVRAPRHAKVAIHP